MTGDDNVRGPRHSGRRWLGIAAVLVAVPIGVAAWINSLVIESAPAWMPNQNGGADALSRARHLIRDTVHAAPLSGGQKRLKLTGPDLAAVADFALARKKLSGQNRCSIEGGYLRFVSSIRLAGERKRFLNIEILADQAADRARLLSLRLGGLKLPGAWVESLAGPVLGFTPLDRYRQIAAQLIASLHLEPDALAVTLNWNRDVFLRAQELVTDIADKERLAVYGENLAKLSGSQASRRFIRLAELLQPMFALAARRTREEADPIDENRALLLVLNTYVNGKTRSVADGSAAGRPQVLLNGRVDTAQHFSASAVLAISGNSALADMIGLAKEMHDTRFGSGFSFNDLAADQAGAVFGKAAVHSETSARRLQERLSASAEESLYMPKVTDLPEHLHAATFAEQFKDLQSREFQDLKAKIRERVLALRLYRPE